MYIMRKLLGTIDLSETIIDSTITQQKKVLFVCLSRSIHGGTHGGPRTTHGPFQAYTKVQVWITSIGFKVHAGRKEGAYQQKEENSQEKVKKKRRPLPNTMVQFHS